MGFEQTKHKGVFKRATKDGDVIYYIRYKRNGEAHFDKIGAYSEGIREAYCAQKRIERLNILTQGELTPITAKNRREVLTFGDIIESYLLSLNNKPSLASARSYLQSLKDLYNLPAQAVRKAHIEAKIKERETNGAAEGTINHIIYYTSAVYNLAIKNGHKTLINPTKEIEKRKEDNERKGFLMPDECKTLLNALKNDNADELYLFAFLLIATGARVSTILYLRGIDCDFKNKLLKLANIKTKRAYNAFIADELYNPLKTAVEQLKNPYYRVIGGQKEIKKYLSEKLQKYLDKLFNEPKGIDYYDRKNKIVVHSLRHSFASNLAIKGVSPFVIKQLLDHASIKQTERYAKIADQASRTATADLIKNIIG
ncbi:MAG: tyrosine-type recombinase/integrase [Helicobacteraceae bacterium]|jgi:site-specific recombinase XerD|nr:tyrosine-type recombinase/integrase [Helicobacteraceae bacterium]